MRIMLRHPINLLLVETTSACNLRCIHCAASHPGYRAETLPLETFNRLLPAMRRYRPTVQLSGHGETLLHKDFFTMLEAAVGAGCKVVFQTNAALLDPERSARLMRYAGRKRLFWINVSLDAAGKELYERIRQGASFDRFVENIEALSRLKREAGLSWPKLRFETVAMLMNIHELPEMVRLAHGLGGEAMVVARLREFDKAAGQDIMRDMSYARPFIGKAQETAKALGIRLSVSPSLLEGGAPAEAPLRLKDCTDPWSLAHVLSNGGVLPCCWIYEPMGNVNDTPLERIWEGPRYDALRRAVGGLEPPKPCLECGERGWRKVRIHPALTSLALRAKCRANRLRSRL